MSWQWLLTECKCLLAQHIFLTCSGLSRCAKPTQNVDHLNWHPRRSLLTSFTEPKHSHTMHWVWEKDIGSQEGSAPLTGCTTESCASVKKRKLSEEHSFLFSFLSRTLFMETGIWVRFVKLQKTDFPLTYSITQYVSYVHLHACVCHRWLLHG